MIRRGSGSTFAHRYVDAHALVAPPISIVTRAPRSVSSVERVTNGKISVARRDKSTNLAKRHKNTNVAKRDESISVAKRDVTTNVAKRDETTNVAHATNGMVSAERCARQHLGGLDAIAPVLGSGLREISRGLRSKTGSAQVSP